MFIYFFIWWKLRKKLKSRFLFKKKRRSPVDLKRMLEGTIQQSNKMVEKGLTTTISGVNTKNLGGLLCVCGSRLANETKIIKICYEVWHSQRC